MSKQLSPEEVQKSEAKRARFRELCKRIADMEEPEREALASRCLATKLAGGSTYSACNQMLIALQYPNSTILGGFAQWLKAGRCVRKGQSGISIWLPIGGKKSKIDDSGGALPANETDAPARFILGTVFDVSQTDELTVSEEAAA